MLRTKGSGFFDANRAAGRPEHPDSLKRDTANPADAAGALETLKNFTVELSCNGALRERNRGANVLGSPLSAISDLLVTLAGQPGMPPIAAGEVVSTGTLTAAPAVRAGQVWETRLEGISLPGMKLAFEA